jgi:hypothetical protein
MRFASMNMGLHVNNAGQLRESAAPAMTDKGIIAKLDELNENVIQAAMMNRIVKNKVTVNINNDLQRN